MSGQPGPAGVHIGLIRAIGPATHQLMPMAALREACAEAGLTEVRTVIATGNLVFTSALEPATLLATLERVIAGFGLDNAVVLRSAEAFRAAAMANPFPDAAASHGERLAAMFLAAPARSSEWIDRHTGPERLRLIGQTLYVDYGGAISTSRLPPGQIEKRLGVTATLRNWNTVMRLLRALG